MTEIALITEQNAAGVATVSLNRPELHNAFDDALIAQLTIELRDLQNDPDVQVVVLAAKGRSFSAGADLNWMRRLADYSYEQNVADAQALAELMHTLNNLAKPTIAKVQGAAFGGGVGLVACCDMAIAADMALFCLSEVKLGLIPAVISPYVVRAIGERQARRYFLTAEHFDAYEARRIGLIHEVVPAAELDSWLNAFLKALAGNGPSAVIAAKELIRAVSSGPLDNAMLEDTTRRIATIRASREGREGLNAFLSKRKPAWIKD